MARSTADAGSGAPWLFDHLERAGAVRMRLGRLDSDAVTGLMTDMLGVAPDPGLAALAAGAGGNPLLLGELIAGLRDEGKIRSERDSARLACAELPQRFRAVVQRWTEALGPRTRQLLAVGAVLGQSFKVGDVAALLGEPPARLLPEVETALSAGVLEATSQALSFGSELVWRAVADSVPPSARQALHRQIGEYLLGQGGSAIEAAEHLAEAGRPCAPAALARLGRAGQTLLAAAPQTAAEVALRALDLTDPGDPVRYPRIVTAVEALTAASRLTEAEQLIGSTLAAPGLVPPAATIWLRSLLSSVLLYSGRPAAAIALAERPARRHPPDRPRPGTTPRSASCWAAAWCRGPGAGAPAGRGLLADRHPVGAPGGPPRCWSRPGLARGQAGRGAGHRAGVGPAGQHGQHADGPRDGAAAAWGHARVARGAGPGWGGHPRADRGRGRTRPAAIRTHGNPGRRPGARGRAPRGGGGGRGEGPHQAAAQGNELLSPFGLAILATSALRGGDLATALRHVQGFQDRLARTAPATGRPVPGDRGPARRGPPGHGRRRGTGGPPERVPAEPAQRAAGDLTAPGWLVRFELARGNREHAEAACAAAGELAAGNAGFGAVTAASAHARGLLDHDSGALRQRGRGQPRSVGPRISGGGPRGAARSASRISRRPGGGSRTRWPATTRLRPCATAGGFAAGCAGSASGAGTSPTPSARRAGGRASPTPSAPCLTWSPRA